MGRNDSTRKSSRRKNLDEGPEKAPQDVELLGSITEDPKPPNHPFGDVVIQFKGDLWNQMKYIWTSTNNNAKCPDNFKVSTINPTAVDALSRQEKRGMLRELASNENYRKKSIKIASKGATTLPKSFPTSNRLSLAAIFVINIALRGRELPTDDANTGGSAQTNREFITSLFAELVGCATADTIDELSRYLRPPLIELEQIPTFIHCVVRQIARGKNSRSQEPVKLAMSTIDAIAETLHQFQQSSDTLRRGDKGTKAEKDTFSSLLKETLSKAYIVEAEDKVGYTSDELIKQYSRDLGCHAGFLVAGFQRYIFRTESEHQERKALCDLFIDVSTGLLTGIPGGGFVFGPVGSVAKYAASKWLFGRYDEARRQLSQKVRQDFDQFIAAQVFFDGEFTGKILRGAQEEDDVRQVSWEEFSKWYEQVILWNQMVIKKLGDKDAEEKKNNKKREQKAGKPKP